MKIKKLVFWILLPLLLAACGGAAETPLEDVATPAVIFPPTEMPEVTQTPEVTRTPEPVVSSECTVVSSQSETSQELLDLFSVHENDWVIGPEDAAVTLIEYGDFQ